MKRMARLAMLCCAGIVLHVAASAAQTWPASRITLVVPYPPGASSDLVGRLLGEQIAKETGQTVVVDNRPGAGGSVGSGYVAKAAPDGYTLLMGNNATHVIQPLVSRAVRYDPIRDFTPIAMLCQADEFLGINATLPARNLTEFIALAKTEPGKLNYGSAGIGSFGQFAAELLKLQAGIDVVHVPYRGSQAAFTDMSANRIQMMMDPVVVQHRDDGQIRLLASSGATRFPGTPDLPTMKEAGLPNYELGGWFGLFGPAKLPPAIADKLAAIVAKAVADPKLQSVLINGGLTPHAMGPAPFAAQIAADVTLFRQIKTQAHIPDVE